VIVLKSTWNEFIKIAAKPRSYLGLAAITALVGVILFALKADGMSFISFVTASFEQTLSFGGHILNGNLVAFIILQMLVIHIPLLVALVTGDLVSGEAAMGTLRMLATKPLSRSQLLISKWIYVRGLWAVAIRNWRPHGAQFRWARHPARSRYFMALSGWIRGRFYGSIHCCFVVHLPVMFLRQ
jgi:ABC-2 type transport system permease protein